MTTTVAQSEMASEKDQEIVRKARLHALDMMKQAGYDIGQDIDVTIDPKLPFMGYTVPQRGRFKIVVSGMAVDSGLLEGLLVHEMSHIYRIRTRHPSHNYELLQQSVDNLGKKIVQYDYQEKTLFDLLNDIQDLYADDIAFQVIRKNGIIDEAASTDFLQSWVKNTPVDTGDKLRDKWINAGIMVHNQRALGQMKRHGIHDTDHRAADADQQFLSKMPPAAVVHVAYFYNLLATLPQELTAESYKSLLADYLQHFIEIVQA